MYMRWVATWLQLLCNSTRLQAPSHNFRCEFREFRLSGGAV